MTTISLSPSPIIIDQTLPKQVVAQITQNILPNDIIGLIASHLKPKHMAKCWQLSKDIRNTIRAENETTRQYWHNHIIKRWGEKHFIASLRGYSKESPYIDEKTDWDLLTGNYQDAPDSVVLNVTGKIKIYFTAYNTEKKALQYFSLITNHDLFILKRYSFDNKNDDNPRMCYYHVCLYVLGESPKAEFLYLAGYYGRLMKGEPPKHYEKCLSHLEKAAEKGHMQAAFELVAQLIDSLSNNDNNAEAQLIRAIKWLRIAANSGHKGAKIWVEQIKKGNAKDLRYRDYRLEVDEVAIKLTELFNKNPHEEGTEETKGTESSAKRQKT